VLADGGELDPNNRLSKETLQKLGRKHAHHFSDSGEKSSLNLFTQNPWFLGRLLPIVKKFNTRRLIDLQSALLEAFEQLLVQPREEQSGIFKDLAIRTLSPR
jgi:DNA polymerase-3 subunit delta